MPDDSLTVQLLSLGFSRTEIDAPDRMAEQLVLSALIEPMTLGELKSLPWFSRAERRHLLAFERLKRTGKITFGPGAKWMAGIAPVEKPSEPPKVLQRSLF